MPDTHKVGNTSKEKVLCDNTVHTATKGCNALDSCLALEGLNNMKATSMATPLQLGCMCIPGMCAMS